MRCLKFNVVKEFTDFLPQPNDFEVTHDQLPALTPGSFLVKAEYISVDPYLRSFADQHTVPYEQFGFQVGKVVESLNTKYPVGINVVSHSGWRDFVVLNGDPDDTFSLKPYEPHIGNLPLSLAVGALGMPGMTAYLGLLDICKPKVGDVVCITSAAGAVGTIVGQIAKLRGSMVIGFTGSDAKVKILEEELGFDHVFNYKTEKDVKAAIRSVTPSIDCFFDNVGGELAANILECMNDRGRVAQCGSISTYGDPSKHKVPLSDFVLPSSVRITPFSFSQWAWSRQKAALLQLREWIQKGDIKVKETVANGFEVLPDTLIAMLKGDNIGKTVVKI